MNKLLLSLNCDSRKLILMFNDSRNAESDDSDNFGWIYHIVWFRQEGNNSMASLNKRVEVI